MVIGVLFTLLSLPHRVTTFLLTALDINYCLFARKYSVSTFFPLQNNHASVYIAYVKILCTCSVTNILATSKTKILHPVTFAWIAKHRSDSRSFFVKLMILVFLETFGG